MQNLVILPAHRRIDLSQPINLRKGTLKKMAEQFAFPEGIRKPIIFIDESYIYQNHVSSFGLTIASTPIKKPSGKGKRVVMIGAISEKGWLGYEKKKRNEHNFENDDGIYTNGSVKYWVGNVGTDYHRNFTSEIFLEYLENDVLPYLTKPSLIIIDRASYHYTFSDGTFYPKKATNKK